MRTLWMLVFSSVLACGSDPEPGLACIVGVPGQACGCFQSDEANDVECNSSVIPGAVCCDLGDSHGTCVCDNVFGCGPASGIAHCTCGAGQSGMDTCMPASAGGMCCLANDMSRCACGDLPSCGTEETVVSECTPAIITKQCQSGTMVAACR
jgi:hypothetical protein